MKTMKKVDGLEVTRSLMELEGRTDLGFEVEVEVEINEPMHAKGFINFMNTGWDYEFVGTALFLEMNDAETHFDHVLGLDGEKVGEHEHDVQTSMEGFIEIATVVNII